MGDSFWLDFWRGFLGGVLVSGAALVCVVVYYGRKGL